MICDQKMMIFLHSILEQILCNVYQTVALDLQFIPTK